MEKISGLPTEAKRTSKKWCFRSCTYIVRLLDIRLTFLNQTLFSDWPRVIVLLKMVFTCKIHQPFSLCGRSGGLIVSALDSGSSGDRGHCYVLGQDTKLAQYLSPPTQSTDKWVPATKCWGVTCHGLASHPGGVAILLAPGWPECVFTFTT